MQCYVVFVAITHHPVDLKLPFDSHVCRRPWLEDLLRGHESNSHTFLPLWNIAWSMWLASGRLYDAIYGVRRLNSRCCKVKSFELSSLFQVMAVMCCVAAGMRHVDQGLYKYTVLQISRVLFRRRGSKDQPRCGDFSSVSPPELIPNELHDKARDMLLITFGVSASPSLHFLCNRTEGGRICAKAAPKCGYHSNPRNPSDLC